MIDFATTVLTLAQAQPEPATAPTTAPATAPAVTPTTAPAVAPAAGTSPAPSTAPVMTSHDTLGTGAPGAATTSAPGAPGASGTPAGTAAPNGLSSFLPIMLLMLVAMMGFSFMTSRREKKKREALMGGLKKNDKVLTIGGILGTVFEVRDNEVVLIVDEVTRSKLRVTRPSIQTIIESAASAGGDASVNGAAQADIKVKTKGEKAAV